MNVIFSVFSGEDGYFVGGVYEDRSLCMRLSHDLSVYPKIGSTIPFLMATDNFPHIINVLIENNFVKRPENSYDVTDHISKYKGLWCCWFDLCSMEVIIDYESLLPDLQEN